MSFWTFSSLWISRPLRLLTSGPVDFCTSRSLLRSVDLSTSGLLDPLDSLPLDHVGRCVYRHSAVYTATRRASCIPPLLGRRLYRQSSAAVYLGTRRPPCIPPLVGRHTLSRLGLGTRTGCFVGGGRARDRSAQASSQTGPAQNAKIHHPKHPSRAHHVVDAADHLRPADLPESPATATLQLPRMGVCLGRLRILYCLCRTCGPWGLGASVSGLGLGTRIGVSVRVGWAKERS